MKLAKIENDVVVNIVKVDPDNIPEAFEDYVDASELVIGSTRDENGNWSAPTPPALTAEQVRAIRDGLLAETDWWASTDLTMTQEQIDYRQALRDITSQEGFPENITFPTKPTVGDA